MFQRIIGLVLLLIALSGITLSVAGTILMRQLVDDVGDGLEDLFVLTSQSLETVEESLLLAKDTVHDVSVGLDTVEQTTRDLGRTIDETRPLISQISQVASEEVPNSIEAMQAAMPNLIQVAGIVDNTLTTLNRFRIERDILGFQFNYDLGINYNPDVPFDESLTTLGQSLDGLPDSLRTLTVYMNITNSNLQIISRGMYRMADDIDGINGRMAEAEPLLSEYIRIVSETNDNTRLIRAQISRQLDAAKWLLTLVMIWLGLTQLAPLYLGWELLTGRRGRTIIISDQVKS